VTAVAIDGPAGAGKSTVARAVARRLGWDYVDSGAMYRAVALAALERALPAGDGNRLGELAATLEIEATDGGVILEGHDVTERIRDADVTRLVSEIAVHPQVRRVMVTRQRALAEGRNVVMEGRDIGSRVLPDAPVKVYLTASIEERAARRAREEGPTEDRAAAERLRGSLRERDRRDSTRADSPLTRPSDALVIDSTGMGIDDVVDAIVAAVRGRDRGR
jgi:cytidylate kinase